MRQISIISVLVLLPTIILAEGVVSKIYPIVQTLDNANKVQLLDETGELTTSSVETNLTQISDKKEEYKSIKIVERYADNNDGTITDNNTSLVWLKDTSCLGKQNWENLAIQICHLNGNKKCQKQEAKFEKMKLNCQDYTIGNFTDWRLPSLQELISLLDYSFYNPVLSNTIGNEKWGIVAENDSFLSVELDSYWSATTSATSRTYAWHVHFTDGNIGVSDKKYAKIYVLPVRSHRY